jgi:hypothetical protein
MLALTLLAQGGQLPLEVGKLSHALIDVLGPMHAEVAV